MLRWNMRCHQASCEEADILATSCGFITLGGVSVNSHSARPGAVSCHPPLGERGLFCRYVTLHRRVTVPVNGGFHRNGLSADCVQPAPSLRRRVHCTLLVTARFHSAALVPRSMSVASPIVQFLKNSDTARFRNCTRHRGQTQVRYPIPIIRSVAAKTPQWISNST